MASALEQLGAASFVMSTDETDETELDPVLDIMNLKELRTVAAKATMPAVVTLGRAELRDALLERLLSLGSVRMRPAHRHEVVSFMRSVVGPVVVLRRQVSELFRRCENLYFLGGSRLQIAAVAAMGKLKYPPYQVWTERGDGARYDPIFSRREEMLDHEAAIDIAAQFDAAIVADDEALVHTHRCTQRRARAHARACAGERDRGDRALELRRTQRVARRRVEATA